MKSDLAFLLTALRPLAQACLGSDIRVGGQPVTVPGSRRIRVSVVGGNLRIQRLITAAVRPGATVVDVGANIGYNTVYAALRVGPAGRVLAIEPALDNLEVLRHNVKDLPQVVVRAVAAGRASGSRDFFLRGDVSAVNSFFPKSCYGTVTDVVRVPVAPLDEMLDGRADLIKIDVEGGEIDVLEGMPRLRRLSGIQMIVEWHPLLQEAAGYEADALPRMLFDDGFTVSIASHTRVVRLERADVPATVARLKRAGRPIELVAQRA